jgi:hypothetical protein
LEYLRNALASGELDPNKRDGEGYTPLWWASHRGNTEKVKLLLEAGADPNIKGYGRENSTPLYTAANLGHPEIVKMLIEAGADVNFQIPWNKKTPLLVAIGTCDSPSVPSYTKQKGLKIVKLLVDAGADLNMVDKYGWTPVKWAKKNNHPKIVKILQGEDVDLGSEDSKNPGVYVYQHHGYRGYEVKLEPGKYTVNELRQKGAKNNDISSLKIIGDYTVILYDRPDCEGTLGEDAWKFSASEPRFKDVDINDIVSSIEVKEGRN